MGLVFRRRIPLGRNVWINLSRGVPSVSVRIGRLVLNTKRGISSVRLGKGWSYRDED